MAGTGAMPMIDWTAISAGTGVLLGLWSMYVQRRDWRDRSATTRADLAMRLDERFEGVQMRRLRARAAQHLLDPKPTDTEGEDARVSVLGFFEGVGYYWKQKQIDDDAVWNFFSHWLLIYRSTADKLIGGAADRRPDAFAFTVEMYERMMTFKTKTSGRTVDQLLVRDRLLEALRDEAKMFVGDVGGD